MITKFAEFPGDTHTGRPFIARMIHTLAVPIILFWVGVAIALSLFVPSLEVVVRAAAVSVDGSAELAAKIDALVGPGACTVEHAGRA